MWRCHDATFLCCVCCCFFLTVHCFDLVLNKAAVRTHISSVFKVVWWSSWDIEYLVCFCSLKFILKKKTTKRYNQKRGKKTCKKMTFGNIKSFYIWSWKSIAQFPNHFQWSADFLRSNRKITVFWNNLSIKKTSDISIVVPFGYLFDKVTKKKPCDIFFVYKNDFSSKNEVICNMRNETIQPKC